MGGPPVNKIEILLDVSNIILDSSCHENALSEITTYLKRELKSDVCSIYLQSRSSESILTLAATEGLRQEAVGQVSMAADEGLTGLAFRSNTYTFIRDASHHPQFKYFPGIGEEPFRTFIGIPLKSRLNTFGVLVFQFKNRKNNTRIQEKLLTAIAAQVSGLVLRHYMVEGSAQADEGKDPHQEVLLQGVPLAEGIAIGHPVRIIYRFIESAVGKVDPVVELQAFEKASVKTADDLRELAEKMEKRGAAAESEIFHTHLLMLEDSSFKKEVQRHINEHGKSAAFSVRHVADKLIEKFTSFQDPYLRERAADIEDICQRLMTHLGVLSRKAQLQADSIIISDRLTPGETASLDLEKVEAFVTEKDGATSHTAILAKNRQIPAVTGIPKLFEATEYARQLIVDGYQGLVIVNPQPATVEQYTRQQQSSQRRRDRDSRRETPLGPILLPDGDEIIFYANVSSVLDAQRAEQDHASGIGLVRTEIFYLQHDGDWKYEQQVEVYRQIVNIYSRGPVIFRLFDIGSDKKSTREIKEDNPALGYRGARLLLGEPDFLLEQVKALLHVIAEYRREHEPRDINILVPFISEPSEFFRIRDVIEAQCRTMELEVPRVGVMLEIPSAVFCMDELATRADYFSIGTNDLFQYFFALDRTDPKVSSFYDPNSQAFLRLLEMIVTATQRLNIPVEICGEIATDRAMLRHLIDLGFRTFSVNPYVINGLKRFVQREYAPVK